MNLSLRIVEVLGNWSQAASYQMTLASILIYYYYQLLWKMAICTILLNCWQIFSSPSAPERGGWLWVTLMISLYLCQDLLAMLTTEQITSASCLVKACKTRFWRFPVEFQMTNKMFVLLNLQPALRIIHNTSIHSDIAMCLTSSAFFLVIRPLHLIFSMYPSDFWIKTMHKSIMRCIQLISNKRLSRNWCWISLLYLLYL